MTDLIQNLIDTASTRTNSVRVFARGDLVEQWKEAVVELRAYEEGDVGSLVDGDDPHLVELQDAVLALEAEMEDGAVEIKVTTCTALEWANLLRKYPPTAEDRAAGYDHNQVKFPPAAIAACAVDPPISETQARRMMESLHVGEWNKLWLEVYALNANGTPSPKLQAVSERLRAKPRSAASSVDEGSLAQPSSAGDGAQ